MIHIGISDYCGVIAYPVPLLTALLGQWRIELKQSNDATVNVSSKLPKLGEKDFFKKCYLHQYLNTRHSPKEGTW